jgi:hypothetical protein
MTKIKLLLLWFVTQVAHLIVAIWLLVAIAVGSNRTWPILRGYDRVFNAATGGSDRETVSSRAYRGTNEGRRGWCLLCRVLDWIQKDHCRLSDGS